MSSSGALILVVGPSGAGKDSIMRGARAALAGNATVRFPRRCITREPDANEQNLALSPGQFELAKAVGGFLLSWEAHGLSYGLPASVGIDLALGDTVVSNVSRGVVEAARGLWPRTFVILITASADVLRARLRARGRDADIDERLARAPAFDGQAQVDFTLMNDGDLRGAVLEFVRFVEFVSVTQSTPLPAAAETLEFQPRMG